MKISLEKRVLLFAFLTLTLTIVLNTGFELETFRRNYRDSILLRSQNLAGGLKGSIEKVLALGLPLEDLEGVNARCQEIVATDPDLVYCLVEDAAGDPLYGSDPSFAFLAQARLLSVLSKTTVVLEMPRWGKVYDVSFPLLRPGGEPAGRVRMGFPTLVLKDLTRTIFLRTSVLLGSAFLLVFGVVFFFTRRYLSTPVEKLCQVAKEIAAGNFQVIVPPMTTREFSDLGKALQEMSASLEARDEKILEGYHDLEEANTLLQQSYEQQEHISAELAESREMYRSLLENAGDAIVVSDEEDQILLMNHQAERFFGFSRDQLVGKNLFQAIQLIQGENIEAHFAAHQEVLEKGTSEMELRFVRPADGRSLIGWVRASLVKGGGGRQLVQAIVRDVTRERQIKANLERSAQELMRLNQMKDSFLGLVSHELKTPLTIILGYADLILSEMSERVDASVLPMVENIASAAERLNSVVQDMVDMSMIDGRRLQLHLQPVEFNQLVEGVAEEAKSSLALRRQDLHLQLDPDLPALRGDPDRLWQMVSHLLGNAIKFTPDGGFIIIETRRTEKLRPMGSKTAEGGEQKLEVIRRPFVELVVRDTGIGIPEEERERIFEKFFGLGKIEEHFSGQVAFKGKGIGLGLAIVQGIVELHGGEIWVESPSSEQEPTYPGCAFHVLLPLPMDLPGSDPASSGPH